MKQNDSSVGLTAHQLYAKHRPEIEAERLRIRHENGLGRRSKKWLALTVATVGVLALSTASAEAKWIWLNPGGIFGPWVPNIPIGWTPN